MSFAKKLFFVAVFLSLMMTSGGSSLDPWTGFASYFHADIKSWLPATGIIFDPLELAVIVMFIAWALRGRRDRRFHFERGLLFWPIMSLAGILAFSLLWGQIQSGGDFNIALWEVRELAFCVIVYFLVGILFTHRRDLNTLIWVILISTFLLAIEDIIRYYFFLPGHYVGDLDYDHDDATVLAFTILLSGALILLGGTRRQKLFVLASVFFDVGALLVTHRRAGEAALGVGVVCLAIITFRVNKRLFFKVFPLTALAIAIYLAAFWNCTSGGLCQPARALTSQINPDPRDQASDEYRYIETQDLIFNIDAHPITGLGFGQKYIFYIDLPDESFWPFWHYTPHNAILWVWVKMGALGFIVFWWVIGSGLYRGGRLIQALSAMDDTRSLAILASATGFIVMQVTVSYVDLGLTSPRDMLLLGVMLGIIGHLPAILRRSDDTDVPARWGRGQATASLATETPEVPVGAVAHALVSPPRSPSVRQQGQSYPPRRPTRPLHQGEGAALWRRPSRPLDPEQTADQILKGSSPHPSGGSDSAGES